MRHIQGLGLGFGVIVLSNSYARSMQEIQREHLYKGDLDVYTIYLAV